MVIVQTGDFDAGSLLAQLRASCAGGAGALVSFTGCVRDFSSAESTASLYLEHYPGMCERVLTQIGEQARQRWSLQGYAIVHRVGELGRGDQIVFVATASAHRGDAFQACEYIMDALKTQAPFWKRETLENGRSFWVESKQADSARNARWDTDSKNPQGADR